MPYISAGFGAFPNQLGTVQRGPIHALRGPIVTDQPYVTATAGDLDRVPFLTTAVMPVGVEVVEARLNMREDALAVV